MRKEGRQRVVDEREKKKRSKKTGREGGREGEWMAGKEEGRQGTAEGTRMHREGKSYQH